MSTALAIVDKPNQQVTKKDLENWLFGSGTKLTEQQKSLFYQISLAHNLNPAKREIYAIPYGNNFNVITGFEVYLKRAERTGLIEWWEAGVKKDGNEYIGFCAIKRKDRTQATTIEAWFNEYNQNNQMWKTKPRTMIRKVAIAQAFRMVFPDELGGLPYTSDELGTEVIEVKQVIDDDFPEFSTPLPKTRVQEMIESLVAAGKLGNAEKFLGKKSALWTESDIDRIEAAKTKKEQKSEQPQSPTTHEQVQVNTQGQVIVGISDAQMDQIEALCDKKQMPLSSVLAGLGLSPELTLIDLDGETADKVIQELARL